MWRVLSPARVDPLTVGEQEQSAPAASDVPLMFPLMLNVSGLPILVVGGEGISARFTMLAEHGASDVHVFAPDAGADIRTLVAGRLNEHLPVTDDFQNIRPRLVFIADVSDEIAQGLYAQAHTVGALVHVQDRIPLCDFHLPARVRRGHLQVTVSTDGKAAGLSRHIREFLETHVFGPEWAQYVEEVAAARAQWKREGLSFAALGKAVADLVSIRGWLKNP